MKSDEKLMTEHDYMICLLCLILYNQTDNKFWLATSIIFGVFAIICIILTIIQR